MRWTTPLLATLALSGCNRQEPQGTPDKVPAAASAPASLVLVTFDTTRSDRIGVYGYEGAHTPNIDKLAAGGVRFTRAFTSVPLTTPSHSTIMTGLYPTRHGVHTNGDAILPDSVDTLAEILKGQGYETAASVAAFVTTRVWNLDQGFDTYYDEVKGDSKRPGNRWMRERPANEVVDDAVSWLSQREDKTRPFFLWVHFYDPHQPRVAPEEWREKLPGRPYDSEMAFMDHEFGRLVDVAESSAGPGGVGWIAVADHGEALRAEHGEMDHGLFIFNPTMHIPFIIQPPTPLAQPKVVGDTTVSNVDVTPTALAMLGVPVPDGLDGVDLSATITGEKVEHPPVYLEAFSAQQRFGYHPELGIVDGTLKLMDTPHPRMYDIVADPHEQHNIIDNHPQDVERMHQALLKVEEAAVSGAGGVVAPEVAAQLAALGYMAGGDYDPNERSDIDAKDKLDIIHKIEEARRFAGQQEHADEAVEKYRTIIAAEPQLVEARLGLARLLIRKKQPKEAETVLREALAQQDNSVVLRLNLISVLSMQGRTDEALEQAEEVLKAVPTDQSARVALLRGMGSKGEVSTALDRAKEWIAEGPLEPAVQAEVGMLLARQNKLPNARQFLEGSLVDDVPRPYVRMMLARDASGRGDLDAAIAYLKRELNDFPHNPEARWALANMLMKQKRYDEGEAEYRYLSEQSPDDVDSRRAWAQAVFNAGDYPRSAEILAVALQMAPDDPEVLLLQANILSKQGKEDEAKKVFEEGRALKAAQMGVPVPDTPAEPLVPSAPIEE